MNALEEYDSSEVSWVRIGQVMEEWPNACSWGKVIGHGVLFNAYEEWTGSGQPVDEALLSVLQWVMDEHPDSVERFVRECGFKPRTSQQILPGQVWVRGDDRRYIIETNHSWTEDKFWKLTPRDWADPAEEDWAAFISLNMLNVQPRIRWDRHDLFHREFQLESGSAPW